MRVHQCHLKTGIRPTPKFAKKGLATHAVNVGTKCGHGCLYCSTGAVLRTHPSFKACGENPFGFGYAIVDPSTPERVAQDAQRICKRGLVQLCTFSDAWALEAQEYQLGRRCLEAILSQTDWTVRVLTKNAAIRDNFDFIEENRDRVLIGLSITAALPKASPVQILEPKASSIQDRMLAVVEAVGRGLRTYAMLCQEALEQNGHQVEAEAIGRIRNRANWSNYVAVLIQNVQQAVRKHSDISKLRFLLYPSGLRSEDRARIKQDDTGVVWLR